MYAPRRDGPASRLSLDVMAFILMAFSAVLSYFIFTQSVDQDSVLAMKAAFMQSFTMTGFCLRPAVLGSWNFRYLDTSAIMKSVAGGGIALAAMIAVVIAPQAQFAAIDFPARLFYANMGIVEEVFFNYFLFSWIATIYPWPVAALLCGGFFAPFHLGVYGWDPTFMMAAIVARFVLCAIYWFTGSLSSAMGAHVAYNVMAAPASVVAGASSGSLSAALALGVGAFAFGAFHKLWREKCEHIVIKKQKIA
jgi:membrane protease YdiL (CAAX protease family)